MSAKASAKPAVTPMMAQYLEIKAEAGDALLFYRMGDFYELFFDDAVAAAAALDISLTKRGEHLGQPIPMCGVPVHSAESYLMTLIRKGFRVAVGEQLETPEQARKRGGSKAVVERGIVRLVTPGTLTEDTLLDARAHNYLAAFATIRDDCALAWADISTGEFRVAPCPAVRLGPDLARLGVREVLLPDGSDRRETVEEAGAQVTELARASFDSAGAEDRLTRLFGVASLEAFGTFTRPEVAAMGALIDYVDLTQRGQLPLMRPPRREAASDQLQIDAATRRNLELVRGASGGREGSLLWAIDRTVTAGGARLLERRVAAPSTRVATIRDRLDAVQWAVEDPILSDEIRATLRRSADMDRALSRLSLDRGGPRDLGAIRAGLEAGAALAERLADPPLDLSALTAAPDLRALLVRALVAEPPARLSDGGAIAAGYDDELDEARTLRDEGRGVIASLQAKYAEATGIASLKVKHNNVLGYFVETTATHEAAMRERADTFIHRQTTANQLRWTTVELSDLETRILNAASRAADLEARAFAALRDAVLAAAPDLFACARALAELDVTTALADLARGLDWCRPRIDDSRAFEVTAGRHPVVERALRATGQPFVANDTRLTAEEGAAIRLLTGPNMAGKSTWLRQNALIAVLAQMGAYVPAAEAHIGTVSQLFSRVGASDDLARGRSTFMVEMVETAAILNQADDRALVILDEIGRGTATYDGLSIAWATLEHLHDVNRCRALFATHYHEMTALAARLPGVENRTVAVKEWDGDVIFLHEVRDGAADRSYGVQVAKLAGLPPAVVARAREVLDALESGEQGTRPKALIDDLPLFSAASAPPPAPAPAKEGAVETRLRDILPDELTPREALDLIYELRRLADP
ncbi:DNA mismatch repair protein MutS [Jannaschia aquimarina]|uniref:DNA mismatch repair protein MutS n=1 Tax=Jannaschia aquimarina TaxID=935700 RepID=A0A0D1CSZ2_9RHOB|nr:DNA mismatch repair protein MutS [Jannaschia aquimarina]KIT17877.1 DNA mismatch repair protein MutS [Jannaschia aquimarina]SNS55749.1 DNA mismatch repair protein MutS [Jannaschia aquimarina]